MRFKEKPSEMTAEAFEQNFGEIYEKSDWVAQQALAAPLTADHDTVEGLHALMVDIVNRSERHVLLDLLRAHPELAGREAAAGELTDASTGEQAQAGLNNCTAEELRRFNEFNSRYTEQFEFPFIMAVKGANRFLILTAFETRILNDYDIEFDTAINEVHKIAGFRLEALCSTE